MWKYVMIGFDSDYFNYCFIEMMKRRDFLFLRNTAGNGLLTKMQKLCISERTNRIVNFPFKQIWMNDFSKWLKNCEYKICFVFSKSQSWLLSYNDGEYFDLLRAQYPDCKIIMYLCDMISTYYLFDVNFFKRKCDSVISYDKEDSITYGLLYSPLPYGKTSIADDKEIKHFDVFFCGKAKNRLYEIHKAYDYYTQHGFNCVFYITDVDRADYRKEKGIIYNKSISYDRYLQYVNKCEAILEITQKNSKSDTLRVKEALTYGKRLLTDNKDIVTRSFYNKNQIYVHDIENGIDIELYKQNQHKEFEPIKFDELNCVLHDICSQDSK